MRNYATAPKGRHPEWKVCAACRPAKGGLYPVCAVYVAGMDKCWLIIKFILQLENVNHSHWNLARGAALLRLVLTRTLSSTVLSIPLLHNGKNPISGWRFQVVTVAVERNINWAWLIPLTHPSRGLARGF